MQKKLNILKGKAGPEPGGPEKGLSQVNWLTLY